MNSLDFPPMSGPMTFKVCLIGNGQVGKTSFMKRQILDDFSDTYIPTIGVEVRPITFHTSRGPITFNVWDCAGQELYGGLRDGYYIYSHAAIFMFDVSNLSSYLAIPNHVANYQRVNSHTPMVICGNKCDMKNHVRAPESSTVMGINYYATSAQSNYNCEEPFLFLARQLTGDPTLHFTHNLDVDLDVDLVEGVASTVGSA